MGGCEIQYIDIFLILSYFRGCNARKKSARSPPLLLILKSASTPVSNPSLNLWLSENCQDSPLDVGCMTCRNSIRTSLSPPLQSLRLGKMPQYLLIERLLAIHQAMRGECRLSHLEEKELQDLIKYRALFLYKQAGRRKFSSFPLVYEPQEWALEQFPDLPCRQSTERSDVRVVIPICYVHIMQIL